MSVQTDAGKALDKIDQQLQESVAALSKIIASETWGSDDLSDDYTDDLIDILVDLSRIRRKLDR